MNKECNRQMKSHHQNKGMYNQKLECNDSSECSFKCKAQKVIEMEYMKYYFLIAPNQYYSAHNFFLKIYKASFP